MGDEYGEDWGARPGRKPGRNTDVDFEFNQRTVTGSPTLPLSPRDQHDPQKPLCLHECETPVSSIDVPLRPGAALLPWRTINRYVSRNGAANEDVGGGCGGRGCGEITKGNRGKGKTRKSQREWNTCILSGDAAETSAEDSVSQEKLPDADSVRRGRNRVGRRIADAHTSINPLHPSSPPLRPWPRRP